MVLELLHAGIELEATTKVPVSFQTPPTFKRKKEQRSDDGHKHKVGPLTTCVNKSRLVNNLLHQGSYQFFGRRPDKVEVCSCRKYDR